MKIIFFSIRILNFSLQNSFIQFMNISVMPILNSAYSLIYFKVRTCRHLLDKKKSTRLLSTKWKKTDGWEQESKCKN